MLAQFNSLGKFLPLHLMLLVGLCALPVRATTWAAWNGITVGSGSDKMRAWGTGTIGTTTGNIGAWNGLAAPSASGPSLSAVYYCYFTQSTSPTGPNCGASATPTNIIVDVLIPSGNAVLVGILNENTSTNYLTGVTDSSSDSLTAVTFGSTPYCADTTNNLSVQAWYYLTSASAAETTFTVAFSSSPYSRTGVVVYSIANAGASILDGSPGCNVANATGTTNGAVGGSVTTTVTGDLVFGGFVYYQGAFTAGTTLTFAADFSNTSAWTGMVEHATQSTAGTGQTSATMTNAAALTYSGTIIAIK